MRYFKLILCLMLCLVATNISAQNKKIAILIGVSNYNENEKWNEINGENDVDLLYNTFKNTLKWDVVVPIKGNTANYNNIKENLSPKKIGNLKGCLLYIHFSLHGRLYQDMNHDEGDGYDESLVPWDAGYQSGKNYILDDELNLWLNDLRQAVGPTGLVVVSLDACHAGGGGRGDGNKDDNSNEEFDDDGPKRGEDVPYYIDSTKIKGAKTTARYKQPDYNSRWSRIIILEACESTQTNNEVTYLTTKKKYGRLTWFLNKWIQSKSFLNDANYNKNYDFLSSDKLGYKHNNSTILYNKTGQQLVVETDRK